MDKALVPDKFRVIAPSPGAWLSMDTAPKDGTRILAYDRVDGIMTMAWCTAYGQWWVDPHEATEYDPETRHPVLWMAIEPPGQEMTG